MYSALAELLGLRRIEDHLERVEQELRVAVSGSVPLLATPAARVVSAGGKRLRSLLVLGVANARAGPDVPREAYAAAVAVELVHAGSLVHDDLLDGARSRRGVPTVNALEGDTRALLIGDFILGRAGEIAAGISKEVAGAIAWSIGALCTGQALESGELYDVDRSVTSALASISGKTADLTATACRVGAYCSGSNEQEASRFAEFGHAFGMSYQLVDDVLDIVSSTELLGKPVGNDLRAGVYTVPLLLARDRAMDVDLRHLMREGASDAHAAEACLETVRRSGAIEDTLAMASDYAERARTLITHVYPGQSRFEGLARFASWYLDWATSNLMAARFARPAAG